MTPALRLYKERAHILEEKKNVYDVKTAPTATRLAYEEAFRDKVDTAPLTHTLSLTAACAAEVPFAQAGG